MLAEYPMTAKVLTGAANWSLIDEDCRQALKLLPDNSIDSLVTDPPGGLAFMGETWDTPGASNYGLYEGKLVNQAIPRIGAHKGSMKEHLKARALFVEYLTEIFIECYRVMKPGAHGLVWAIPKTSHWTAWALEDAGFEIRDRTSHLFGQGFPKVKTLLKPACEDWWLIRKPFTGTIEQNIQKWGVGSIDIDVCRIEQLQGTTQGQGWPSHVTVSHDIDCTYEACTETCAVFVLDEAAGRPVSRFFYCPKPTRKERELGLDNLPAQLKEAVYGDGFNSATKVRTEEQAENGVDRGGAKNIHSTVKSIALMRWLCRLVTPKGGIVLDTFAGSGTTGCAAVLEGLRFIGMERENGQPRRDGKGLHKNYSQIATARIEYWEGTRA